MLSGIIHLKPQSATSSLRVHMEFRSVAHSGDAEGASQFLSLLQVQDPSWVHLEVLKINVQYSSDKRFLQINRFEINDQGHHNVHHLLFSQERIMIFSK